MILPWQKEDWRRLSSQVHHQALPHALLFSGLSGLGKSEFALQLSHLVFCERAKDKIEYACGECKQCKLFKSETHPDFKVIKPEEGSSTIKVDQIRDLVTFFAQSSQQGGYKVAILYPAETLNINAANALLKTLEEPSQRSLIILISNQAGMLLPTIRSRCQVVDFILPSLEHSMAWLKDKQGTTNEHAFSDNDISLALTLAHSAPLTALAYLEKELLEEHEKMLIELGSLLKNEVLATQIATRWNDDRANLRLAWMMAWLEYILKLKFGVPMPVGLSADKMFSYLADKAPVELLNQLYQDCSEQYRLFLGTSNPNKVMAFEVLLNDWLSLMRKR